MSAVALLTLAPGGCAGAGAEVSHGDPSTLPECCRPKVAEAPRVIVVTFRTEDCEACRAIAPLTAQMEDAFTSAPVLFTVLDFTTPRSSKQSEYLAKVLGLDEMWKSFARQSGYVLILDGATRKPLTKITRHSSVESYRKEIEKALAGGAASHS